MPDALKPIITAFVPGLEANYKETNKSLICAQLLEILSGVFSLFLS